MKKYLLYGLLVLSVLTNIFVLCYAFSDKDKSASEKSSNEDTVALSNYENRQKTAEIAIKKLVCDNLYYPQSYDPVSTQVDSVFYNYLTDVDCVEAAIELIDMRKAYETAKDSYDENNNNIKTFGGSGVFHHFTVDRNAASAKMKELRPKIERRELLIKNRDTSKDGTFIGWQVIHRYRASNSNGVVSFGDVLYILNPQMNQYFLRYSLDKNDEHNLESIKRVIESELNIYTNE